jgi:hypothetical protein
MVNGTSWTSIHRAVRDSGCREWKTRRDLLERFEASLSGGEGEALQKTTGDFLLNTRWRMLSAGKLVSEQPRYVAIRDGVLNHMAHHRGQLTVYASERREGAGDLPSVGG